MSPALPQGGRGAVGVVWLTTVRWATMGAGVGAIVAGHNAHVLTTPAGWLAAVCVPWGLSNLWLIASNRRAAGLGWAGPAIALDVLVLTGLLWGAGGILNPATIFYLVQIVVAALVLGRAWTWVVTALSVVGYASLYLMPSSELSAALGMHREVGLHMNGMGVAYALTALIVAILVVRLAVAVEQRDRELALVTDRAARAARAAGLSTLAAGAAHELSTPLSTIAVSARDLERHLVEGRAPGEAAADARLILTEIDRCRAILHAMAGSSGEPMGEAPAPSPLGGVLGEAIARLAPGDRARVDLVAADVGVVWPIDVVVRAIVNVVQNALRASDPSGRVELAGHQRETDAIRVVVTDRGVGMAADVLARAGEPFFTTRVAGAGSGLGLFVARSTVEQIGGALVIESAPGRGTTVTMTLPGDVLRPASAR